MRALLCWSILATAMVLDSDAQSNVDSSLSLATYNIRYANRGDGQDWWGNRSEAVGDYLERLDVFGLQEVTFTQLENLRQRLVDFDHYGVGRDDGKHGGEHAVIFFRKNRFKEIARGTFWLSESPEKIGVAGWDAALPRTCTWVRLQDTLTSKRFLVANTHFDHRGVLARKRSGQLVRDRLLKLAEGIPVILLGDFNCTPGSEPYANIELGGHFADARGLSMNVPKGPKSTWNGFREIAKGRIIDHVFVHGSLQLDEYCVDDPRTAEGRFASDHLPVRIIVQLGDKKNAR